MRSDMSKKLVERPRIKGQWSKGHYQRHIEKAVRIEMNEDEELDSAAPSKMAMSIGRGSKILEENLNPLFRFLESRCGKSWNKVYSEIRKELNTSSTIHMHILQHLDDYVEKKAAVVNGVVFDPDGREAFSQFYVDGLGLLRKVPRDPKWRPPGPREDLKRLTTRTFLMCISGIWYLLTYNRDVDGRDFDSWPKGHNIGDYSKITWRCKDRRNYDHGARKSVDNPHYLFFHKKQLNRKELTSYKVENERQAA